MSRLSRTSRTRSERIQASYVNRHTDVGSVEPIEPVKQTDRTNNQTSHPTENQLLSYERYYQLNKQIRKTFKEFYKQEKMLYHAATELDEHEYDTLTHIQHLVQQYNKTITKVKKFDELAGTTYALSVYETFQAQIPPFNDIGLTMSEDHSLLFEKESYLIQLEEDSNIAFKRVQDFKNFVLEYRTFARGKKENYLQSKYDQTPFEITGLIIEEEG